MAKSKFRITTIQPNECIGNSLNTINTNFENLETRADGLQDFSNELVDWINSTVLFQPVNFNNRSNDTVEIENEKPENKNLKASPWWSKSYKVTVPKLPKGCVGILVHVFFNTNTRFNNQLAFYVKDRDVAPGSDETPNKKETNRYNLKFTMDSTGGNNASYEAESDVTFPIYLDTTNKNGCTKDTFHWRIRDNRKAQPKGNKDKPYYEVKIRLLGYYLDLNLSKLT